MVRGDGVLQDSEFSSIRNEFRAGDLLVLNNTRVVPARVFARKESGGRIEIMLERVLENGQFLAQLKASRSPKPGAYLTADDDPDTEVEVLGRDGSFFLLRISDGADVIHWFNKVGHMPLPPYIERPDESADESRYQTVFARREGAVAAPTAGLHFDQALLETLRETGVDIAEITLHVGAGTYQPVRVDSIQDHKMHQEWIEVGADVVEQVRAAKARGGRVFAVGTTVVRALESAAPSGELTAFTGDTDIFIYPGFDFRVVDRLLTNFHLPKSTLMMLVSAFSKREFIMQAYEHAVAQRYRFFSYGDCMLLERGAS